MTAHAPLTADSAAFAAKLDKLAEVAVKVGLGLAEGQELVMTASLDAVPLARRITEHAYKAGASLVTTIFLDDESALARYKFASEASFDKAPAWLYDGMAAAFRSGAARLGVVGDNPSLLAGQDPDKVARSNRARAKAYQPALEEIVGFSINWNLTAAATPAWAKTVFPNDSEEVAMAKLWDAIFAASRVDNDDPVAAWAEHNRGLHARSAYLNGKSYQALRFTGPGTDLTVGLGEGHEWAGGSATAKNGITCNCNIPTEEVFTAPHKDRVSGTVRSTKPLSYMGTLIEDIEVRFENGAIVDAKARKGQEVLSRVLDTDEGARRLGEVALVPYSSPISKSGLLFYNTLFDENASSHIALGQSYAKTFKDGTKATTDELTARGANRSQIHIDWMIGSAEVNVDGITAAGAAEPLMRKGEWVI